MNVTMVAGRYCLEMSAAERDAVLLGPELAVGILRGEPEVRLLVAELDADALDGLADRLFLAAGAPIAAA